MKKFLPNLVLALALALCALCVVQWAREARVRAELAEVQQARQVQTQTIANADGLARRYEAEIARLDARVKELKQSEQSNAAASVALQISLRKAGAEAASLRVQITTLVDAVDHQNENTKRQNEVVTRQNATVKEQNESLQRLADERSDLVGKLNARTREFNDLVAKFNDLIHQVEQLRKKGS